MVTFFRTSFFPNYQIVKNSTVTYDKRSIKKWRENQKTFAFTFFAFLGSVLVLSAAAAAAASAASAATPSLASSSTAAAIVPAIPAVPVVAVLLWWGELSGQPQRRRHRLRCRRRRFGRRLHRRRQGPHFLALASWLQARQPRPALTAPVLRPAVLPPPCRLATKDALRRRPKPTSRLVLSAPVRGSQPNQRVCKGQLPLPLWSGPWPRRRRAVFFPRREILHRSLSLQDYKLQNKICKISLMDPQGADPTPPLWRHRRQVEIIWTSATPPSSPLGIGERYSHTI